MYQRTIIFSNFFSFSLLFLSVSNCIFAQKKNHNTLSDSRKFYNCTDSPPPPGRPGIAEPALNQEGEKCPTRIRL